jgi:hypothetical protein
MLPFFNTIKNQKWLKVLLLVFFLVPTYFIHTQKYPDWGDDFAQYVYQSQQINSPSAIYKQVLNVEEYSSPKRSVFFSVILSTITPTLQIQNYVNVISITYIISGIVFFVFLSHNFSVSVSFISTLAVFYNFLFLRLKSEVVPEFIFISLFYAVLYLIYHNKKWVIYVIPVLLGLLVSVRFIGLSLVFSYICLIVLQKDKAIKDKLKMLGITMAIFMLVISCINYFFINSIHNQEVKLYSSIVFQKYELNMFFGNINRYARFVLYFFEQEIPYWINTIIAFFAITFFVIGLVGSVIKQKNIFHFSFGFYLMFLFCYPYNGDTIKYLIPIVPLLFYYIIVGFKTLLDSLMHKYTNTILVACLSIVFLSNYKTIWLAMKHVDANITPYDMVVLHDFETIKSIVDPKQTIAFGKPFIINLLVDRNAYFLSNKNYKHVFAKADFVLSPKQKVTELYPKIKGVQVIKGDTMELQNFYLLKL